MIFHLKGGMILKSQTRNVVFSSLILFFSFIPFLMADNISPNLHSTLHAALPDEEISVIIYFTRRPLPTYSHFKDKSEMREILIKSLKKDSESDQKPAMELLTSRNLKKIKSLWMINALSVSANKNAICEVSKMKNVEWIDVNSSLHLSEEMQATSSTAEWNIEMIKAPQVWNAGCTGSGIIVANMDSGVDIHHDDLKDKWRGGNNSWYDPNGQHSSPHDTNGHGTQTMGIMLGGDAGGTSIGVAPSAQWIAVKIFNDNDQASKEAIHLGFQWLLDPDGSPSTDDAPDIVNNSWGLDENPDTCILDYQKDIQTLQAAGIALVFSCGNSGPFPSTSVSPANYPEGFSTGAVDRDKIILSSSGRGPSACNSSIYPCLVAPGVNIKTSGLTGGGVFPRNYSYVSGTSFAAPHVTGAMALLLSAFPASNISELESVLMNTASDLGDAGPDNTFGHGLLDIEASYNILKNIYAKKANLWVIF